jgi:hypothetical protein
VPCSNAAHLLAGVDFFTFQRALSERQVLLYTEQMLASDIQSLNETFSK